MASVNNPDDNEMEKVIIRNKQNKTAKTQFSVWGSDGCGIPICPVGVFIIAFIESAIRIESTLASESIRANESARKIEILS